MASKLNEFISSSLGKGYSKQAIETSLTKSGWENSDIKNALEQFNNLNKPPLVAPSPSKKNALSIDIDLGQMTASKVLLYIGGLIIVIAAVIYISINWTQWSSLSRILAIFIPMALLLGTGGYLWRQTNFRNYGLVFSLVGSLIFPFFLFITFRELHWLTNPDYIAFSFTISLLSFLAYIGLRFLYPNPIWVFLYSIASIFGWYSLMRLIGFQSIFESGNILWMFLPLSFCYFLVDWLFERDGMVDYAKIAEAVGSITLVGTLILLATSGDLIKPLYDLFNLTPPDSIPLWSILLLSPVFFTFAAWTEKTRVKDFLLITQSTEAFYLLSAGSLLVGLTLLSTSGELFKWLYLGDGDAVGWSFVLSGLIFLLVSRGSSIWQNYGLEKAHKFTKVFDLLAPLYILGGIFSLGLGGKKPVYETLLLLASLAFIFASTVVSIQSFLITGSAFLVIYIFDISSEYFSSQIGWPVALFFAGLMSMGIGFGLEKLRRKYFSPATVKLS